MEFTINLAPESQAKSLSYNPGNECRGQVKTYQRVTMDLKIAVLPGDGIGVEVIAAAMRVLEATAKKFEHKIHTEYADVGWAAIDKHGTALPEQTREICRRNQAIFFGAVGLPDRDKTLPQAQRPERVALLELRKGL